MSLPTPGFRLTLIGVNGQRFDLMRPGLCGGGIGLMEWPDRILAGDREHRWQQGVSQVGADHRGVVVRPLQVPLHLILRGPHVGDLVERFLDAVGSGERQCSLLAMSPRGGVRQCGMRLQGVSEIDWLGVPGESSCRINLVMIADRPLWRRRTQTAIYHASDLVGRGVQLPIDGECPVWPRFIVRGFWESLRIGMGAADHVALPYRIHGWMIDTNPEHRVIQGVDGPAEFTGFVPHWPEPITPRRHPSGYHLLDLDVEVSGAGPGFELTVEITPEMRRAW